jgi:hypothetical protein
MTENTLTTEEEKAFHAGIVFERNRIIDLIQNQIDSCPVGIEECNGCTQDSRLVAFLLQQYSLSSDGESSAVEI